MLTYRDLDRPQRRALDRFARAQREPNPMSAWPELRSESVGALERQALIERAGAAADGEPLFRLTDQGSRVHEEMWRDGKVPHHPVPVAGPGGPDT